jgi:prepilin-type N-terminal cleavage/methylation domain-containing protein
MKTKQTIGWQRRNTPARLRGFTLVESLIAMAVLAIMAVALSAGISQSFSIATAMRQNLRATQILAEKMEMIRLYNWDQITAPDYVPATFAAPFYANDSTNAAVGSLTYSGTVTIADPPITENYKADMRMITIDLTWTAGNQTHSRTMTTFVSRYGLQNYIY